MAGREFQAARDSLVAELSTAKKAASKSARPAVKPDRRKHRERDPLAMALKTMGIQIQDVRAGIGDD